MIVLAWLFGVVVLVVVIAALVTFLNHFYRKSSRDVAIIRTGFGGQLTYRLEDEQIVVEKQTGVAWITLGITSFS